MSLRTGDTTRFDGVPIEDNTLIRRQFLFAAAAFPASGVFRRSDFFTHPGIVDLDWPVLQRYAIRAPSHLGKLVETHVEKMLKAGFAEDLSRPDLHHGHIIWAPGAQKDAIWKGELTPIAMIVYHTQEYSERWRLDQKDLPPDKRTPRSIVGFLNGDIVPAKKLIDVNRAGLKDYIAAGTIHPADLIRNLPRFAGIEPDKGHATIAIAPKSDGRFTYRKGRFEAIFLDPERFPGAPTAKESWTM